MDQRVWDVLPFLRDAPPVRSLVERYCRVSRVPAGRVVCTEGAKCGNMLIVLAGSARVFKTGETGREITLYRLEAGEGCILTASSIVEDRSFPATAVAEVDVDVLLIPAAAFRDWVHRFDGWQDYLFGLLTRRLAGVIALVEEVTFRRMDQRLAGWLLSRSEGETGPAVAVTHEAIASELGTSREVVSRLLKDFERAGWVVMGRGSVTVRSSSGLRSVASDAPPAAP